MRRAIAVAAVAAGLLAMTRHRPLALPFYLDASRTPVWIAPGSAAYPQIHRVADFALLDQDGTTITARDVAGKIYVASFFYTGCQQLCPRLRSNLARVQQEFRRDPDVLILSHTVTPEHDDTAVLRRYAATNGIVREKWHLLTGPVTEIEWLARTEYFAQLPDSVNGVATRLLHSETLVLVDQQRHIRGIYDGSLAYDVDRLIADIYALK